MIGQYVYWKKREVVGRILSHHDSSAYYNYKIKWFWKNVSSSIGDWSKSQIKGELVVLCPVQRKVKV